MYSRIVFFVSVIGTNVWDKCTSLLFLFYFYNREITRLMCYLPCPPNYLDKSFLRGWTLLSQVSCWEGLYSCNINRPLWKGAAMELLKTAPVSIVVLQEHRCNHLSGNAAGWRVVLGLFAGCCFLGRCERPFFSGLHADPYISITHGWGCTVSFWERRPSSVPSNVITGKWRPIGVWLSSCVAARWGLVLLKMLGWLALLSGQGDGEEAGKRRLWDSPKELGISCLFILTFGSERAFDPLGSLSLESFLFSFSCSDSPLEEKCVAST